MSGSDCKLILSTLMLHRTPQDAISKKDFLILHYTYGQDFDLGGRFMQGKIGKWRFDKRQFMSRYPPRCVSSSRSIAHIRRYRRHRCDTSSLVAH
jgi:hypothetical protein